MCGGAITEGLSKLDPTNPNAPVGGVMSSTGLGLLTQKPKEPDAPDFTGAAEATAAGNLEMANLALQANRPDQFSPFGSQTWTQDESGNWTSTTEFSPEVQSIIDQQLAAKGGYAGLAGTAVDQAREAMGEPLNLPANMPTYQGPTGAMPTLQRYGGLPTFAGNQGEVQGYQGAGGEVPQYAGMTGDIPTYSGPGGDVQGFENTKQGVMDRMLSRVNTDIQREKAFTHDQLIAKGIPPGSEAYNRSMEQIDRKQTDARQQAEIAASQIAGQEYQNYLSGRQQQQAEATGMFGAKMQARQQAENEALSKFSTQLQSRGIQNQEAMDAFNTAITARGVTQQEAKDNFNAQMQRYGLSRQESQDIFDSLMQTRQMTSQEELTKYNTRMQNYRQAIQDALLKRQTPINELSAILSGSQVQTPTFSPGGQMVTVPGADYLGAAQGQSAFDLGTYNADVASQNAILSGLFGLGAAGIGAI